MVGVRSTADGFPLDAGSQVAHGVFPGDWRGELYGSSAAHSVADARGSGDLFGVEQATISGLEPGLNNLVEQSSCVWSSAWILLLLTLV